MKEHNVCPKCGCVLIFRIDGIKLAAADPSLGMEIAGHPSVPPPDAHHAAAYVCAECSFIELYATTPLVEDGGRVRLLAQEGDPDPESLISNLGTIEEEIGPGATKDPGEITAITAIDGSTTPSQLPPPATIKVVLLEIKGSPEAIFEALKQVSGARVPKDKKALSKALPFVVVENVPPDRALKAKETLEAAGGLVDLVPLDSW